MFSHGDFKAPEESYDLTVRLLDKLKLKFKIFCQKFSRITTNSSSQLQKLTLKISLNEFPT